MKYKIEVDVAFTDKFNEKINYQPGDIVKTKVDEKRKDNIVDRGLGHVVEEIDTTNKEKGKDKGKKEEQSIVPPIVPPVVPPTTNNEPPTDNEPDGDEE